MADDPEKLLPVTEEDVADSISFALRFNGRKRFRGGDEFMAHLTAKHVVEHLRLHGYVFMTRSVQTADLSRAGMKNPPVSHDGGWTND
jgi:hypothetical protein